MRWPSPTLYPSPSEYPESSVTGRELTPLGEEMLEALPPVLRDSADYQAVIHAIAKETELAAEAMELVRRQFNPATADVLLGVWERVTRQTVEPAGSTISERQEAVTARLRKMLSVGEGSAWVQQVTALIGAGWSYEENIPGDLTSPPAGVLRIKLPFPPEGSRYTEAHDAIREVTPAHLELELEETTAFRLDQSELDVDEMTI